MQLPPAERLLELRKTYATDVDPGERNWMLLESKADTAVILPSALPPALFRGQNARHVPCLTALARGLTPPRVAQIAELNLEGQANLADRVIRRLWFCKVLEEHPATKWLSGQRIRAFEFALAQHYGLPTGYMDLSESFDVACFFATCQRDKSGEWQPCSVGTGIIYMIATDHVPIRPEVLQPIGLQVLPRPREQFGWVLVCGIGNDFEDIPRLQMLEFSHNESVSRHFLEKFARGRALFPPDAMATVADQIMKSRAVPASLATTVIADLCRQAGGLTFAAEAIQEAMRSDLGLRLEEEPQVFTEELRAQAQKEWASRRDDFFRRVGFDLIPVRPSDAG